MLSIFPCHCKFFVSLVNLVRALVYLQLNLLTRLVKLKHCYARGRFACTYFVSAFKPVPYRYPDDDANIPYSRELTFKAVVKRRVCHKITTGQRHLRQISRTYKFGCLTAYIYRILKHFQLRTVFHCCRNVWHRHTLRRRNVLFVFVFKNYIAVHRQSAKLAKQHFCKRQAVVNLRELHFRLVDPNVHFQSVGSRCDAFFYHFADIAAKFLYKFKITCGKSLLMFQ